MSLHSNDLLWEFAESFKLISTDSYRQYVHPGFTITDCNAPTSMLNKVFVRSMSKDDISSTFFSFKQRKLPHSWRIADDCKDIDQVTSQLLALGCQEASPSPGMIAQNPITPNPIPDGLEIIKVSSKSEMGEWYEVWCEGFGITGDSKQLCEPMFCETLGPGHPNFINVIARYEGKTVCTASYLLRKKSIGIYNVVTNKNYRGRGFGRAITQATCEMASERSKIPFFLFSSPMGHSVYKKMGFNDVVSIRVFTWS